MELGAHVLLPHGWAEHPAARYPVMIFHGHFPHDLSGFRTEPPDPDLECEYSERFRIDCYNRMYFHGKLIQIQDFPVGVPAGTMMLRGPKTQPTLFVFNGHTWFEERTFESCVRAEEF